MVADALRRKADSFLDLQTIETEIKRDFG
jgi:hypothetical protein